MGRGLLIAGEVVLLPLCLGRRWVTAGELLESHCGACCSLNGSRLHLSRLGSSQSRCESGFGGVNPTRDVAAYVNLEPEHQR